MKRLVLEHFSRAALAMMAGGGILILSWILLIVGLKGSDALSLAFLIEPSGAFGESGGILYQILGTAILMVGAVALGVPLALGAVLFHTEFVTSARWNHLYRMLIYSLNAVPTILFGLIGYLVFGVFLETGVSWLTGVLILAVMILPTLHVSFLDAVESIPKRYRESGQAMGLTPWQMMRSIVIPQSLQGIVTGTLLSLARAAGETAAIMFTATTFSGVTWPESWTEPVPTLQTHILVLAQEAVNPEALAQAWGAAWVLIILVSLLIGMSVGIRRRWPQEAVR